MEIYRQSVMKYIFSRLLSYFSYKTYLKKSFCHVKNMRRVKKRSSNFSGYPENHNFSFYENKLTPSFKLFERFEKISELYPENMKSLLDVSCCRGFYVLEASMRESVQTAVGIDVVESFVNECNAIKMYIGASKVSFSTSTLEEMNSTFRETNKVFDVVVFTGSYHYFYWGSGQHSHAYMSHDRILKMLADMTNKRVVFSGRLEVADLAEYPKSIALSHPDKNLYTTKEFLKCAEKYFTVSHHGFLGRSDLFLLEKR